MLIRGVDFGRFWAASGVFGFNGEGYWFHQYYKYIPGFTTEGMTFVSKTVTTNPTTGNMPLLPNWQPLEHFPQSIWWNWRKGIALNAIGLSNFGIRAAIEAQFWKMRDDPFMLSWMPMGHDHESDAKEFVEVLLPYLEHIYAPKALQVNCSCPSTGQDLEKITKEAVSILKILEPLNIPLVPKFNILTSPEAVARIAEKTNIGGVVISNTLPFGTPGQGVDWSYFKNAVSPLTRRSIPQPGGLSGDIIFPIVRDWVMRAKEPLKGLPINFCGGLDSAAKVEEALSLPNVESVSVATAVMLRPWRLKSMIRAANG